MDFATVSGTEKNLSITSDRRPRVCEEREIFIEEVNLVPIVGRHAILLESSDVFT
jgi:hypothetical protein